LTIAFDEPPTWTSPHNQAMQMIARNEQTFHEQTDSSTWRLRASFYKLVFVGISEASITGKCKTFKAPWKSVHDQALKDKF